MKIVIQWWLRFVCIEYEFSVTSVHCVSLFVHKNFHFPSIVNTIFMFSLCLKSHMHAILSEFDSTAVIHITFDSWSSSLLLCVHSLLPLRLFCCCSPYCYRHFSFVRLFYPSILNNNKINNSIFFHPIRFIAFVSLFCLFGRFRLMLANESVLDFHGIACVLISLYGLWMLCR